MKWSPGTMRLWMGQVTSCWFQDDTWADFYDQMSHTCFVIAKTTHRVGMFKWLIVWAINLASVTVDSNVYIYTFFIATTIIQRCASWCAKKKKQKNCIRDSLYPCIKDSFYPCIRDSFFLFIATALPSFFAYFVRKSCQNTAQNLLDWA